MTTTPDTTALEDRKRELEQHQRSLVQAETQQTAAQNQITAIEVELKERGYDPSTDLSEQLAAQEKELDTLTTNIGGLLRDVETQLASPEETE